MSTTHFSFREYVKLVLVFLFVSMNIALFSITVRTYLISRSISIELTLLRETNRLDVIEMNSKLKSIDSWIDAHTQANIPSKREEIIRGYKTP